MSHLWPYLLAGIMVAILIAALGIKMGCADLAEEATLWLVRGEKRP